MLSSKTPEDLTLEDVVTKLDETGSVEIRGLLMAATIVISYLKKPAHEITLAMMKERQRYLPLFRSSRRLPRDLIDNIVAEVGRLIKFGEDLQNLHLSTELMTELPPCAPPV